MREFVLKLPLITPILLNYSLSLSVRNQTRKRVIIMIKALRSKNTSFEDHCVHTRTAVRTIFLGD